MFTQFTKNFGIWKEERRGNKETKYVFQTKFLFYLGFMVFLAGIVLVLIESIKKDFFYFESSQVSFSKDFDFVKEKNFLFQERSSSLKIFMTNEKKNHDLTIYFDSGENFSMSNENTKLKNFLQKKVNSIIFNSMLLRMGEENVSRVQIWSSPNVTFEEKRVMMNLLRDFGYDDFDFAVEG